MEPTSCSAIMALAEGRTVMNQKRRPATIDEAVGVVIAILSDEEKAAIALWRSLN
jgi:hypothetical protein